MQTIPSLGIALPAALSPEPRPPTGDSGSSFADYLRRIDDRSRYSGDDRSKSPGSASISDGKVPERYSTATDSDNGAEKQRIAAERDSGQRRTGSDEGKATKNSMTDPEQRGAKRVSKRSDDAPENRTGENDPDGEATKAAASREHTEMREQVAKRGAPGVADGTDSHAGGDEDDAVHTVGRDRRDTNFSRKNSAKSAENSTAATAAGRAGKRQTGDGTRSETAKSGKPGGADAESVKSGDVNTDAASSAKTAHPDRGESVAMDQDNSAHAEKTLAGETPDVSMDQQAMAGAAGKNGGVGTDRPDANAVGPEDRNGRARLKADKAGRSREARGDIKSGDSANRGDETHKRIVADIEVNLREESESNGTLKGDKTLSDGGDRQGGAAETDSTSFLTRLEHAPNTPTQRQATAQQAAGTLARRLNGDLGANIVRQAKVMLKEANQAEIRLIIRPPELGRVRINMHMENGHIAGRILVDNGSVREAVEQNLAALQRAFEEAGLEVGDFEVSTGDSRDEAADDRNTAHGSGEHRRSNGAGQFADSVTPVVVNDYSHRRINLVA